MSRPRTATAQLEARGSFLQHPERKRARSAEPRPTGELGEPPDELSRKEKAAWRYIASLLPPGVVFNSDRVAMEEAACLLITCRTGRATAAERNLLKSYLRDFGMTPADRSRVRPESLSRALKKIRWRSLSSKDFPYRFNYEAAAKVCRFAELCPHVKGRKFVDSEPGQ